MTRYECFSGRICWRNASCELESSRSFSPFSFWRGENRSWKGIRSRQLKRGLANPGSKFLMSNANSFLWNANFSKLEWRILTQRWHYKSTFAVRPFVCFPRTVFWPSYRYWIGLPSSNAKFFTLLFWPPMLCWDDFETHQACYDARFIPFTYDFHASRIRCQVPQ